MRKYNLAFIIIAAVLLEVTAFVQYFLVRKAVTREIVQKANYDMEQSERIVKTKAEVESALRNCMLEVESLVENPDDYYAFLSRLVVQNQNVIGAGIGFVPGYYTPKGKPRLYGPYAYDEKWTSKNNKQQIVTNLMSFDYTKREWYTNTMGLSMSLWTEPYMDQAGSHVVMCSYTVPIKDKRGKRIGVLFADVPLKSLSAMSVNIYGGIDKVGMLILVIQLVGFVLMVLLVWRSVVSFRRWKAFNVDSDKERLAEKVKKLTEVNRRLIERNVKLASQLSKNNQHTTSSWYSSSSVSYNTEEQQTNDKDDA